MSPAEAETALTPFEEVNDERRTLLVDKLAKLMLKGELADPAFWAFIWLSDIEKLEEFYNLFAPLNRSLLSCQYGSSSWGRVLKMFALGIAQDHASQIRLEAKSEIKSPKSQTTTSTTKNENEAMVVPSPDRSDDELEYQDSSEIYRLARASSAIRPFATTETPVTPSIVGMADPQTKYYIRSATLVEKCRTRDNNVCALTKTSDCTQVAHIYPLSLRFKDGSDTHKLLWMDLEVYFSAERIKRWKKAAFDDQRNETLTNLLCLGPVAYELWSKCRYALKPIELSSDGKCLTLQFFWMPRWNYVPLEMQEPPEVPDNTDISACSIPLYNIQTGQRIRSGDIITFTTTNPETFPLPSMDLLDMQWILHRLNALSGAAAATDEDLSWNDRWGVGPRFQDGEEYGVRMWVDEAKADKGDIDDERELVDALEAKPLTLRLRKPDAS